MPHGGGIITVVAEVAANRVAPVEEKKSEINTILLGIFDATWRRNHYSRCRSHY